MKKTLLFYSDLGIKGNLTIERRKYCTNSSNDCHYDVKNDLDICKCNNDFEFILKFVSSSGKVEYFLYDNDDIKKTYNKLYNTQEEREEDDLIIQKSKRKLKIKKN